MSQSTQIMVPLEEEIGLPAGSAQFGSIFGGPGSRITVSVTGRKRDRLTRSLMACCIQVAIPNLGGVHPGELVRIVRPDPDSNHCCLVEDAPTAREETTV